MTQSLMSAGAVLAIAAFWCVPVRASAGAARRHELPLAGGGIIIG
jgi:hypothetical protein